MKLLLGLALLLSSLAVVPGPDAEAADAEVGLRAKYTHTYTGFDRTGTHETFSGTAVGDITGDGQPDVIAGAPDGFVRGWHLSGGKFLEHWVGPGAVHATPGLVDLDSDGVRDVLVAGLGGDVVGVRGDGRRVFHARDRGDMPRRGVFSTPTAADIDRDGRLEVVATSWDHHVHVWNLDGSHVPGFPRFVYDTLWSSPAVADLDGDGWLEIVFGGDMDDVPGAPYPAGGLVWVFRHDGSVQPGWPRSLPGQVIWSSPAVVDLSGDGLLDVVVGTGLNWPDPAGRQVHALQRDGSNVAGWPVSVGGRVMGSPAVGDVTGDGRPNVITLAEDGRLRVHHRGGRLAWARCVVSDTGACRERYGVHGQASIGDVDGDGTQEVVVAAEHWLRILDGATGAEEASFAMPGVWAPPAAPSVVQIGGEAWIFLNTTVDSRGDGAPGVGDTQTVWAWSTGQPLGRAEWPTFKQNQRRTGAVLDEVPPVASMGPLAASQARTDFAVSWSATDDRSGVATFDVQSRTGGGSWVMWLRRTTERSGTFYGLAGESYELRVRARDKAGNVGAWSAPRSTTVDRTAASTVPYTSMYAVAANGSVSALSSPPVAGRSFPPKLGQDIAVAPDGKGGYILDGWGGVHAFGNAPSVRTSVSGYWPGWNIAREIALNPDGRSGYKADGYGGLHPFGGAAGVRGSGYWSGRNLTRDLVLLPSSTPDRPAGYVLDAFGGVHPFGAAPRFADGGRRWGFKIARGLTANPDGPGAWILDGWGGIHSVGGAPKVGSAGYWPGWDITRGVVAVSATQGYVLDGFGGVRGYGGAPKPAHGRYWGRDVARALAVAK